LLHASKALFSALADRDVVIDYEHARLFWFRHSSSVASCKVKREFRKISSAKNEGPAGSGMVNGGRRFRRDLSARIQRGVGRGNRC